MSAADVDVIVVGGGPAGSALGTQLARAGLEVAIIDRARFPRSKPCAEYLSPQASRLLHDLGVLEEVEALGPARLAGMRIHAPDGAAFQGAFAASHGFRGFRDRGLALPRRVLDQVLLRRAAAAGARVMEGLRVTDVVRDARGRATGVATSGTGGPGVVRARLVVGADGLRTVVGRRLGLVHAGRWPRRYGAVAHFGGVSGVGEVGEMHVFDDGYVGLADVGGGVTNVAVVVPGRLAGALRGRADDFVREWVARRASLGPRFVRAERLGHVEVAGPFNQRAPRAWSPGAALVGDAADFFDPFTGEGIYAALRGSELLVPYAFEAVRARSARGSDVALAAYDRARRHEFAGKWRVERLVGTAVAFPRLMNHVAGRLAARPAMADLLVGVAGDFVPPAQVLRLSFVARLLGWPDRPTPGATPDPVTPATLSR